MKRVFIPVLLFPVLFLACNLGTPTPTTTTTTTTLPTSTAVQVKVEITQSKNDDNINNMVTYWVYVTNNGEAVSVNSVTVNGVNVPFVAAWSPSYELTSETSPDATFVPGATYTVVVSYNGNTYTDSMTSPGGITVNSDSTLVSWTYNGNASSVSVNQDGFAGTNTFSKSSSAGNLTNPLTIPSSAYPSASTDYNLHMNIKTTKSTFGALAGSNTYFNISDFWLKKVVK